tara:strand:- start:641 stop:844 length:204 start_codon:yes stop_codon:yes gene_type:complete
VHAQELREKSNEELQMHLEELLREQFNLRMQKGSSQLVRHSDLKAVRRNIARTRTIMHEKTALGTSE